MVYGFPYLKSCHHGQKLSGLMMDSGELKKWPPPPLCNNRTTSAAAIHPYPIPIYHMYTMGASTSLHVSVGTHIPLHQQPARTEFSSMMCDFHPIIIPYRILMGNNTNNPLHTAYINTNGAVSDGITCNRDG